MYAKRRPDERGSALSLEGTGHIGVGLTNDSSDFVGQPRFEAMLAPHIVATWGPTPAQRLQTAIGYVNFQLEQTPGAMVEKNGAGGAPQWAACVQEAIVADELL